MRLAFTADAWDDLQWWMDNDRQMLKKVRRLIAEAVRSPREGAGKPERLKHYGGEVWSRRITQEHRFVYDLSGDMLTVIALRFHYE